MSVATVRREDGQRSTRLSVWGSSRRGNLEISAAGHVDAANAKEFALAVCGMAGRARRVTLDLSDLDFMAFDGVAALHAINAQLTRGDAAWCVVPSAGVSRVLQLSDPEHLIPLAVPHEQNRGNERTLRLV
jgi:anti-anti-sigma factor